MNGYATARQNGWMSANDIRELENLDRIPAELGGDLYLINGNMTKLEDAGIFALLVHGIQTFLLILLGIYGLAALPFTNKTKKL